MRPCCAVSRCKGQWSQPVPYSSLPQSSSCPSLIPPRPASNSGSRAAAQQPARPGSQALPARARRLWVQPPVAPADRPGSLARASPVGLMATTRLQRVPAMRSASACSCSCSPMPNTWICSTAAGLCVSQLRRMVGPGGPKQGALRRARPGQAGRAPSPGGRPDATAHAKLAWAAAAGMRGSAERQRAAPSTRGAALGRTAELRQAEWRPLLFVLLPLMGTARQGPHCASCDPPTNPTCASSATSVSSASQSCGRPSRRSRRRLAGAQCTRQPSWRAAPR